jgi:hypothetical protein
LEIFSLPDSGSYNSNFGNFFLTNFWKLQFQFWKILGMEEIGLFPAFTNQNSGINVNNWKNGALPL